MKSTHSTWGHQLRRGCPEPLRHVSVPITTQLKLNLPATLIWATHSAQPGFRASEAATLPTRWAQNRGPIQSAYSCYNKTYLPGLRGQTGWFSPLHPSAWPDAWGGLRSPQDTSDLFPMETGRGHCFLLVKIKKVWAAMGTDGCPISFSTVRFRF